MKITDQLVVLQTSFQEHTVKLLAVLFALLSPIQGILITVGICIFADTIVGIWKARKIGEPLKSRKLGQLVTKMLIYQSTIIVFYLIDKYMLGEILSHFVQVDYLLTKAIALVLASIEIFSIDENMRQVKGSGLWEAFKTLIGKSKQIRKEIGDFDINEFTNNKS